MNTRSLTKILLSFLFLVLLISPFNLKSQKYNTVYAQTGATTPSYFPTTGFNTAAPIVGSQAQQTLTEAVETQSEVSGYLQCGWDEIGCQMLEWLLVKPVFFIFHHLVAISGMFLDFFLKHSISSNSYRDAGFISQGWEILRDFANIAFIFSLLFAAFEMVLGAGWGYKGRIIKTLLVALVVNFSLFISLLVIDTGNVLAWTFYSRIDAPVITLNGAPFGGSSDAIDSYVSDTPSISLAIADRFDPQNLFQSANAGGTNNLTQKILMVFIIGIVDAVVIYTFISVAFLFLGRTIGLYLSAMLSALAFTSMTLPSLEGNKYIGFKNWLNNLISMSFMAPVFLFFLFMAIKFMNINMFATGSAGADEAGHIFTHILGTVVPMAAIIAMILMSKSVAKDMAGTLGNMAVGYVNKAMGAAVLGASVVATGGAALAGGALRGAGAVAKLAGSDGAASRLANWGKTAQSANFNFAQMPGVGKLMNMAGADSKIANSFGNNLSYSRLDTAARTTLNKAKILKDNALSGLPSEAVNKWQENIKKSKDSVVANQDRITQEKIEAAQEKALETMKLPEKDADGKVTEVEINEGITINLAYNKDSDGNITGVAYDYEYKKDANGNIVKDEEGNNIVTRIKFKEEKDADGNDINKINIKDIKKKKAELNTQIARRSLKEKEDEEKQVRENKQRVQKDINKQSDESQRIKKAIEDSKKEQKKIDPTDKASIKEMEVTIAKLQDERDRSDQLIENLKDIQKNIDKTTLAGQIKQLEKLEDKIKAKARRFVIESESDAQAAKIASGKIKTTPKFGTGEDDKKDSGDKKDDKK
jgi:hypothetical protein